MERATKKHSAALEQRRSKAARFLARRADALARAQMQREQQLEKASQEQLQQETVESRREFLQQLHLERLRQEHNWVQSRMVGATKMMPQSRTSDCCSGNSTPVHAVQGKQLHTSLLTLLSPLVPLLPATTLPSS